MSITNPRPVPSLCALPFLMLSCQELNPEFCTEHPADVVCFDAGVGGGSGIADVSCASDSECASPAPVCEKTRSMCVQCTADEPGACGGATPICGDDDVCRSCAIDAECESMTCLPDRACAAALDVLYVAIDGSGTSSCIPMEKCSLLRAIALIDGTRSTIRLDPGWYMLAPPGPYVFDFNTVAFNAANGTVPGPGVTCQTVQDAATVLANNIVFTQVSGDRCSWVFSDIAPIPPIPIVEGNIVVDPQFVDVAQGDFHLGSDSPLRDAADPAATLGVDIDGQARPQGTGREMGADEIK